MQNQNLPVLIFAQSGRFLAQSATQAGYRVWVADCFGDQDTLAASERWLPLTNLSTLSSQQFLTTLNAITKGEACSLIYGSGIEYCYDLLEFLPDNIELLANSASNLERLNNPQAFFNLLHQLDLPFPVTTFKSPDSKKGYIAKPHTGNGGNHIGAISPFISSKTHYFQKKIDGISGSALFLADSHGTVQIVSINKQYPAPTVSSPYRLGMIETANDELSPYKAQLSRICTRISTELNLKGLNSLDFIISKQNTLLVLELNPRPSASMLLNESPSHPIIQRHIDACLGKITDQSLPISNEISSLRYIYASRDINIANKISWPLTCGDLPSFGSKINCGEPICTTLVKAINHVDAVDKHNVLEQKILVQLT